MLENSSDSKARQEPNDAFTGKVAVITGAAIGIGFEMASRLAQAGASVLINDVDEAAAIAAKQALSRSRGACEIVVGDASELSVVQRMVDGAIEHFGRVDIAIANAGVSPFGAFLDYSADDLRKVLSVNLEGTFFLAQAAAKQMIKQSGGGRILMMSSVTGYQFHPDATAYGMTKAAIRMLVKNLGVELASEGIRVNGIAPGATLTERTQEDAKYDETWSRITPAGRPATTTDIANVALFLLSDNADHITGQTLVVDGGWTSISPRPD